MQPLDIPRFDPVISGTGQDELYEDGRVFGAVETFEGEHGKSLTIYEWFSDFRNQGHTIEALKWLRAQGFSEICARRVGTLEEVDGTLIGDIATCYWAHLVNKGLVDRIFDDDHCEIAVAPDDSVSLKASPPYLKASAP